MKAISIDRHKISGTSSSLVDSWARKLVLKWLKHFSVGHLTIEDQGTIYHFGQSIAEAGVSATIQINHWSAYSYVLLNGTVGAGEAFMKGTWQSPRLVNVIRLMCRNMQDLKRINNGFSRVNAFLANCVYRFQSNTKANAKLNIAAHYDLGNDFFSLFLDSKMMYSAAIYPEDTTTLNDAATYKLEHICQRLQLKRTDHLLEIGTGWGGMAVYAAKHYGCRVTTTTISKKQYHYACDLVKQAGLEDKITVLLDDYRDLKGQYDKLVSVEMIEAVGRNHYQQYFSACHRLLKVDGLMLIQAITLPDQRYVESSAATDFIQRYIFPGGDLPCLSVMATSMSRFTNLHIVGVEDITWDYARTLADWRDAFFSSLAKVKALGYNDTFIRMWDFYLSYCEGGFMERKISTIQLLAAKPQCQCLPPIIR